MKILKCLTVIAILFALSLSAYGTSVNIPVYNTLEEFYDHEATFENLYHPYVGYDAMQSFGDFRRYQYDFGEYTKSSTYILIDANRYIVCIDIIYPDTIRIYNPEFIPMDETMTNMLTHPSGMSGFVRHNKIIYQYEKGYLTAISWKIADIEFKLDIDWAFGAYPLDAETTPISRLLSTDKATAYSVVEELADSIDPDGSYRAAYTAKICLKAIAAVLIIPSPIVLTLYALHLRSRKRRRLSL